MRTESAVFAELRELCASEGYIHALALLCFRDNIVAYAGELSASDLRPMLSADRLNHGEISTLTGLLVQQPLSLSLPSIDTTLNYIDRTEALLKELHEIIAGPIRNAIGNTGGGSDPFSRGELLREVIFYSAESAYNFQYRDLATTKYGKDDGWLKANRGFTISEAIDVAAAIARVQSRKFGSRVAEIQQAEGLEWTIFPAFCLAVSEVVEESGFDSRTVTAVLDAFAISPGGENGQFTALNDFNISNSKPLIKTDAGFVLLQSYCLFEALYDAPFYWLMSDDSYSATAARNRGTFTETFCRQRLERVFGPALVYANVDVLDRRDRMGEIDVLVAFGDRAIVLQAKSKRLTLAARRGNDRQIQDDFKKSVQDAYDQALLCAKALTDGRNRIVDQAGRTIPGLRNLKEVYLLCVVSDHYPALSFQVRQFLKYESSSIVQPPIVLDVFALDAMTEFLSSPLRFLSYINRRTTYGERLLVSHEIIALSYHLKYNLWLKDNASLFWLNDDFSADLDVAMSVRRDSANGPDTPDGVLTRTGKTSLGRLLAEIEHAPEGSTIDLGFLLLAMSEKAVKDVSAMLAEITVRAGRDGQNHDLSTAFDEQGTGLTIHCNNRPVSAAEILLERHCKLRKYIHRAQTWFGICVHPFDGSLRFGLKLDFPWEPNSAMDEAVRSLRPHAPIGGRRRDAQSRHK